VSAANDDRCGGEEGGQVAIAADTLVTFGDTACRHRFEANSKIFKVDAVGGPPGSAWPARWRTFRCCARPCRRCPRTSCKLHSKDEVFDTFTKLHPLLKETFFLQTKEEDNDPYESSQFSVADCQLGRHLRAVQLPRSFRVQGILGHVGSGRSFALGAMHALGRGPKQRAKSPGRRGRRLRIRPQFRRTGGCVHDQTERGAK
jgi:ATP-dependent HslUV protease subunit HslV